MPQCHCLTKGGKGPQCKKIIKIGNYCSIHKGQCIPIKSAQVKQAAQDKQLIEPKKQIYVLIDNNTQDALAAFHDKIAALKYYSEIYKKEYGEYLEDVSGENKVDWNDQEFQKDFEFSMNDRHVSLSFIVLY